MQKCRPPNSIAARCSSTCAAMFHGSTGSRWSARAAGSPARPARSTREWQRAGEHRRPPVLLMIDIDHFKLLSDRYGHVRDDCVSACGGRDTVASDAREGRRRRPLRRRGVRVLAARLDVGRTAALAEEARRAVEDLLITHADAADRALYAAKRCGCNAVVAHESMVLRAAS